MPYIDGKRVSVKEWTDRYSSLHQFHTGPRGENPAPPPAVDADTGQPTAAGGRRSPRSEAGARAAIADAMGVKNLPEDIDVQGASEESE